MQGRFGASWVGSRVEQGLGFPVVQGLRLVRFRVSVQSLFGVFKICSGCRLKRACLRLNAFGLFRILVLNVEVEIFWS